MHSRRLFLLVSLHVLLAGLLGAAEADTKFKTYQMKMPSDDVPGVVEVIKEAIGAGRQIFHYKRANQLLISATPQEHKLVETLLKEINIPAPNIRLDVTFRETGKSHDSAFGAKGSGKVIITPSKTRKTYKIKPRVHHRSGSTASLNVQTLVVQNGREASLMIGNEVPFYEWIIAFGNQWDLIPREVALGLIERELVMEKTGSYLVAQPQIIGRGPLISVTLVPEIRGLVGNERKRIRFAKVSTTVTVADGQSIPIGGSGRSREFFDKFLVGVDSSGNTRSLNITLSARILKPDGRPANP